MSKQIEIWDPEESEWVKSKEEYAEYQIGAGRQGSDDWGARTEHVTMRLYIHERTGIATTDVAAFERWLTRSKVQALIGPGIF